MKKYRFLFLIALAMFIVLPFKVDAMKIFVKHVDTEDISLEVESSDTIETVKLKVQDYTGFPSNEQILMYNSKVLEEGKTLADYEIQASSTINLELIKTKVILDANGGKFTDSEQYIINDYFSEEFIEPTREGYTFKSWYTEKVGGKTIDYYLEENQIEDNMTFYAQWDKEGIATVDFTTFVRAENWTDLENAALNLIFDKGLLVVSENKLVNNDGKLLLTYENDETISFSNDLSPSDNIVYTLTEEDKETIRVSNNKITSIPDVVEVIFVKEIGHNVTFEANGGTFKDSDKYIIEKWNNEYYDTLTIPTKEGYKFLGYYTEKTGGTKLEMILAESGIDSDMTFYAQWEENSSVAPSSPEEENPNTFDDVGSSVFIGTISLIGLIGAITYLKKRNQVRV